MVEERLEETRQMLVLADRLMKEQGLPVITAFCMAGDRISALRADKLLAAGWPIDRVVWTVGPLERMNWAIVNCDYEWIVAHLSALWCHSDPDDTDDRFLGAWLEAHKRNGYWYVRDGPELPAGEWLTVYRGQIGEMVGIRWTCDRVVAERFAQTGGGRLEVPGGRVLERRIKHSQVLAYLTQGGESEVVVRPSRYGEATQWDLPKVMETKNLVIFHCFGCREQHAIPKNKIEFNGDVKRPSFLTSVNIREGKKVCHFFMYDGIIHYCADSTHRYRHKTVEMPAAKNRVEKGDAPLWVRDVNTRWLW